MPPYWTFPDPETGEPVVREMTEKEFAAFPDPQPE